jgi:hypothetical protein
MHTLCCRRSFAEPLQAACEPIVSATVELYNAIRAELLPTPSKSHYTFNLRDMSKVVQVCGVRCDSQTHRTGAASLSLSCSI